MFYLKLLHMYKFSKTSEGLMISMSVGCLKAKQSIAKMCNGCPVTGVGMCLYAQLVQTKNT